MPSPIRLATLKGSGMGDSLITAFSLGNPGVHSEIWFEKFRVSAFRGLPDRCVLILPFEDFGTPAGEWHVVDIPVSDVGLALSFIEEAAACEAHYHYSLPEFGMPKVLLDRLDQDLDCTRPSTWDRLFCSQFALLFLRRCSLAGVLQVAPERQRMLWGVNSRGCLPSRLRIIADRVFK